MWHIEPPAPAQEAPIYIAAKLTDHKSQKKEIIYGGCWNVEAAKDNEIYQIDDSGISVTDANYYMRHYENKLNFFGDGSHTTMTMAQSPMHGNLNFIIGFKTVNGYSVAIPAKPLDSTNRIFNAKNLIIQYIPKSDYLGNDYFTIEFKQDELKIKIKYFIVVDDRPNQWKEGISDKLNCEIAPGKYKKGGSDWKISLLPSQTTDDLDSWLRTTSFQAMLSNAVSAVRGFSDLPGLAAAQTTGTQITLDTNAAGYGWYRAASLIVTSRQAEIEALRDKNLFAIPARVRAAVEHVEVDTDDPPSTLHRDDKL